MSPHADLPNRLQLAQTLQSCRCRPAGSPLAVKQLLIVRHHQQPLSAIDLFADAKRLHPVDERRWPGNGHRCGDPEPDLLCSSSFTGADIRQTACHPQLKVILGIIAFMKMTVMSAEPLHRSVAVELAKTLQHQGELLGVICGCPRRPRSTTATARRRNQQGVTHLTQIVAALPCSARRAMAQRVLKVSMKV